MLSSPAIKNEKVRGTIPAAIDGRLQAFHPRQPRSRFRRREHGQPQYLFFADVAKQLGHKDLAKLFRDTAAQ